MEFGFEAARFGVRDAVRDAAMPCRVCTLGFGSLNHGIWPLIRVFGNHNLGLHDRYKLKGSMHRPFQLCCPGYLMLRPVRFFSHDLLRSRFSAKLEISVQEVFLKEFSETT